MSATAGAPALRRLGVTLDDCYTAESGPVLLSGIRALVRTTLDQRRLDRVRGHDTAVFVSGYQGSPLGGLDRELARARGHLDAAGVVFRPGVNEELAATAVGGTQLLGQLARRRHEGVTGFWYGKAPGLDRAADAIRHANLAGTAPLGGAVAWIGDDPAAKSSTVPSASEPLCRSLMLPLLAPGEVGEALALGLHAVALSRHAGLWVGMKLVADVADASAVVSLDGLLDAIPQLPIRAAGAPPVLLPPGNLDAEQDLLTARLALAAAYARDAGLNRIAFEPRRARVALVAAGAGYQALLRALDDLGLDEDACDALGLRLVRLAMPWPLERGHVRALLAGVETVLVVEDKLPFVESQLRDALYRVPGAPLVLGREDAAGHPLLPARSAVGADDVALALGRVVGDELLPARGRRHVALLAQTAARAAVAAEIALPRRTPYFCSGCPHNASTRARSDELVGVGIGCHIMVALEDGERRGQLLGMPQMGGEGAQWLGLEPFTDDEHFVQNLGDGTFHHSGSLAIRAAVAAGARMTYRLLYNDAVAMTGGQRPEGRLDVPTLTRLLALEGVRRIVVTTPEPGAYRGVALDPIASVRHRDELRAAQDELAAVDGVTALIHDDRCATEERRLRKRGKLPAPAQRVWINERVCEGCGDCGEVSSCLSVVPVQTELGRKTQIHQSSCNQDFSCLKGDCPSFLLVTPRGGATPDPAGARPPAPPVALPDPVARVPRDVLIRMPGVGGTGVVTVSAILQMAAHLDGRCAAGLDQTGLAQKGGPVLSDVRIADAPIAGQLRASAGGADVLLGFDLLGAAAPETLAVLDPARTVAVVNTAAVPTAAMITDPSVSFPAVGLPLRRIEACTRAGEGLLLDAERLAERLFGDHMPANLLLVGAAFQHGCLPLSAAAIEHAIELNGAAVEVNLAAFAWGRAWVADRAAVEASLAPPPEPAPALDPRVAELLVPLDVDRELRRLLGRRVAELIAYQDAAYAQEHAQEVARVAALARERAGDAGAAIAQAYARGLFKLMAYKDEYEVARLHLDATERARREQAFGERAKVQILLHPPLLRALGLKRKLRIDARLAAPLLHVLRAARRLRGTPFDPFGRTQIRRTERALIAEYRTLVADALDRLDPANAPLVAEIADLPDLIRGYEQIKLAGVDRFRTRAQELADRLEAGPAISVTHVARPLVAS
jgi:indolepyruvate ferredoxin oxidoreductase